MTSGGLDDPTSNGPRLLLADHHDALEEACRDLAATTYGGDSRDLVATYRAFERAVLEHLGAEEDEVLPSYSLHNATDAQDIRRQHGQLKALLHSIGIEVEIHAVRAATLMRMIELLRAHAAHEDAKMYPWAQLHLPLTSRRRLFLRVGRSMQALQAARRAFKKRAGGTR